MKEILDKPGFISIKVGSEMLRNMFQKRERLLSFPHDDFRLEPAIAHTYITRPLSCQSFARRPSINLFLP